VVVEVAAVAACCVRHLSCSDCCPGLFMRITGLRARGTSAGVRQHMQFCSTIPSAFCCWARHRLFIALVFLPLSGVFMPVRNNTSCSTEVESSAMRTLILLQQEAQWYSGNPCMQQRRSRRKARVVCKLCCCLSCTGEF
jgi:hypothetical protein